MRKGKGRDRDSSANTRCFMYSSKQATSQPPGLFTDVLHSLILIICRHRTAASQSCFRQHARKTAKYHCTIPYEIDAI